MQKVNRGKSTHHQDKRAQEFCQEFLDYPVFECAVVPHAATSGAAGRRFKLFGKWEPCDAAEVQSPRTTSAPRGANAQPLSAHY